MADGGNCYCSPIIITLKRHQGYKLTSTQNGVWFDIDGDGALDNVGWTRREDSIGFLVFDRNRNGLIDSGRELFGNATLMANGSNAPNGFAALAELDSNEDGVFDAGDAAYGQLRLWIDENHDAVSQADEYLNLAEAGIDLIYLGYRVTDKVDRNGNQFYFRGTALIRNSKGVALPTLIYDAVLAKGGN